MSMIRPHIYSKHTLTHTYMHTYSQSVRFPVGKHELDTK